MARKPVERTRGEKPDTQLFSLRLAKPLWAELSVLAKLRGKSMNEMLGEVLQDWWNSQPERPSVTRLVKASGTAKRERKDGEPE